METPETTDSAPRSVPGTTEIPGETLDLIRPARDEDWPGWRLRAQRAYPSYSDALDALQEACRRLERVEDMALDYADRERGPEAPEKLLLYQDGFFDAAGLPEIPGCLWVPVSAWSGDELVQVVRL